MHPAKSVIIFTTTSGAGYGLLVWLAVGRLLGWELAPGLLMVAFGVAFGLIITGLLSSTLHLGHPERAWRAMSQWRSSWLSREGLAAIITFAPAAGFATVWILDIGGDELARVLAAATAALALFTVYCTAMIYASLRAIPAWANPWTAPGYLALSVMSGALLLNLFSAVWPHGATELVGMLAAGAIVLGHLAKALYWSSLRRAAPVSSAESATGLGGLGQVRLFEAPHTSPNYLLKEMGFQIARKHAEKLRWIAIISGFLLPFTLVLMPWALGEMGGILPATLAVVFAGIGVAVERWLFFAEARHVQMLYYGESAV